ncbi:MAG: pyridoxamine 5'-phosphate oxidase [Methylophilaceae bacterium 17-44-8]|nr:MAG: pyridoxamine 5'-phosphate oxidase [Methylophilales bacterium 28-44-11]OZA06391.1 MAG: pyridoxamine 5'-phosphate oxidase [Methylophilaceae bacterium 17-44-8]
MSRLYGEQHRTLQDAFGTTQLADRVEAIACKTEFDEDAKGFIEHLDMFFLSSVDHQGRPTVSFKGGDAGFVKVIDATTLMFPSYDGNGMFFSMGNISTNPQVGLLFISFEKPHRIRVQGTATLSKEPALLSQFKEAEFVVLVKLSELWQNCPRYIPQMQKVRDSRYVPRSACETPVAEWKRIDLMQDVILEKDKEKVETLGTIDINSWVEKIKTGHPEA